ncbi:hypothetical protein LTS18_011511, partial [Coniosporium uncinatum]
MANTAQKKAPQPPKKPNGITPAAAPPIRPQQAPSPIPPMPPALMQASAPTPTPAPQPTPRVTSKPSTIWPSEKKGQLAEAAAKWINAVPENSEKRIANEEISVILDGNLSYIELCELLEAKDLKLDRAGFARALLTAVPDVNSASKKAQAQAASARITNPPNSSTSTGIIDLTSEAVVSGTTPGVQRYVNGGWRPANSPKTNGTSSAGPAPVAQMMPSTKANKSKPEQPSSRASTEKPATKEDAARKRTFADLVDLSNISDDDEPVFKKLHNGPVDYSITPDNAPPFSPAAPGLSAPTHAPRPNNSGFGVLKPQTNPTMQSQQIYTGPGPQFGPAPGVPTVPGMPKAPPIDENFYWMDVVEKFDKKNALRRSTYNIKTIARDVLLATGKHPEMAPLNAHLDILRQNFRNVDLSSDLSTFRWDLVDPGEPLPPPEDDDKDSVLDGEADDEGGRPERPPRVVGIRRAVVADGGTTALEDVSLFNAVKGLAKVKKPRGRPPRHSAPGAVSVGAG